MDANIADHASRHGYTNTAYSAHTNEVTLPPLRRVPRNYPSDVQMAAPILPPVIQYPQIVNDIPRTRTCCLCRRWIIIGLCISIMFIVPLAIGLGVGLSNPKTTSSLKTTTSPRFRFPAINYTQCNGSFTQTTLLLNLTNANEFNFTQYTSTFTANSTQNTIVFAFRHDTWFWFLDDVSVIDTYNRSDLITDGGFEDFGTADNWNLCSYGYLEFNVSGTQFQAHSGLSSYMSGIAGSFEYLSQTLNTTVGRMYNVSFWLMNGGGPVNGAIVFISNN